ncbi:hypothetical protein OAO87_04600 [bacterium]|nr:hypothetical protein [bacterium]
MHQTARSPDGIDERHGAPRSRDAPPPRLTAPTYALSVGVVTYTPPLVACGAILRPETPAGRGRHRPLLDAKTAVAAPPGPLRARPDRPRRPTRPTAPAQRSRRARRRADLTADGRSGSGSR